MITWIITIISILIVAILLIIPGTAIYLVKSRRQQAPDTPTTTSTNAKRGWDNLLWDFLLVVAVTGAVIWTIKIVSGLEWEEITGSPLFLLGIGAVGIIAGASLLQGTFQFRKHARTIGLIVVFICAGYLILVAPFTTGIPGMKQAFGETKKTTRPVGYNVVTDGHKFNGIPGEIYFPEKLIFNKGETIIIEVEHAPVEYYRGKNDQGEIWETIEPNIGRPLKEEIKSYGRPTFRSLGNLASITVSKVM